MATAAAVEAAASDDEDNGVDDNKCYNDNADYKSSAIKV